ncbi:MAG: hypothetical protein DWQ09_00725 [Proteobacteria bacterium]|nr:MAG: hypothetical protein DWQ09_00725 [Pseudomonadota bacterium]QKK11832.1 MAG: hypothetical protein HND59_09780 [Pseudomonadota bacterium]
MVQPLKAGTLLFIAFLLLGCQSAVLFHQPTTGNIRLVICERIRNVSLPTRNNKVPIWAPSENRFAYFGAQHARNDIFVATRDGSGFKNLTGSLAGRATTDYAWGSDGRWLYFTWENTNDNLSLYRVDTRTPGSVPVPLSPLSLNSRHPSISTDNRLIVFASTGPADPNDYDLYTSNLDGSNRTLLVRTIGVNDILPSWASDGRVAFVRGRDVVIRQADGSLQATSTVFAGSTPLTLTAKPNRIAWSKDNRYLAYEGGGGKIYRVATTAPFAALCVSCAPGVGLHLDRTPVWYDEDEKLLFHRYVGDPGPVVRETGVVVIEQDGTNEQYIENQSASPDASGIQYICL